MCRRVINSNGLSRDMVFSENNYFIITSFCLSSAWWFCERRMLLHTHLHTFTPSLSLPYMHTHTHIHARTLMLAHTLSLTLFRSLFHVCTHTRMHTHTRARACAHAHTNTLTWDADTQRHAYTCAHTFLLVHHPIDVHVLPVQPPIPPERRVETKHWKGFDGWDVFDTAMSGMFLKREKTHIWI